MNSCHAVSLCSAAFANCNLSQGQPKHRDAVIGCDIGHTSLHALPTPERGNIQHLIVIFDCSVPFNIAVQIKQLVWLALNIFPLAIVALKLKG